MQRKTKTRVKKSAKRMFLFGFISIATICIVLASVFKIVFQIVDKYKEANSLERTLDVLKENEGDLNKEILKLQDPDYLARYAREKYFYSKSGELIIRIPSSK